MLMRLTCSVAFVLPAAGGMGGEVGWRGGAADVHANAAYM